MHGVDQGSDLSEAIVNRPGGVTYRQIGRADIAGKFYLDQVGLNWIACRGTYRRLEDLAWVEQLKLARKGAKAQRGV
jgi:hypothetical protein